MNCPVCHNIMSCRTEIHHTKHGDIMDLHCYNENCLSRKNPFFLPYMKILAPLQQKWICLEYGFPFYKNNKLFVLSGAAYTATVLTEYFYGDIYGLTSRDIYKINFVEISTDNDMHTEATKLFNKMYNLIPFS